MKTLRILVLRGGPGAEREISLWSGRLVAESLRRRGYTVREADITPDDLGALDGDDFDVVFPVLHGTFGEDGRLQQILEERRLRYVGSNSVASALAMDKHRSKLAFAGARLLTPDWIRIDAGRKSKWQGDSGREAETILKQFKLPVVVKPNAEGSSVGVLIVRDPEELVPAVLANLSDYGDCLIEQFIPGREMTVGIIADTVLPVLEIKPAVAFYDWKAKYVDNHTQYCFDVGFDSSRLEHIQSLCKSAFDVLGCRDLGRIDLIADEHGRDWLLEVNTIPGLTDHSLLPKAAGHEGMSLGEICEKIAQIAFDRPIEQYG